MSERALLDTSTVRTNFAFNVASVESSEHVTVGMEYGYEMFDRWLAARDARVRREALELSDEEACAALDGIAEFMDDDPEPMDDGLPIEMAQAAFAAVAKHREALK